MTTILSRGNGTSITYQNVELITILNNLETSNSQHSESNGVAFARVSLGRLLILDVDTLWCRRILEIYAITYDASNAFGLQTDCQQHRYESEHSSLA